MSDSFKFLYKSFSIWMGWIQKVPYPPPPVHKVLSVPAGAIFREIKIWNNKYNDESYAFI